MENGHPSTSPPTRTPPAAPPALLPPPLPAAPPCPAPLPGSPRALGSAPTPCSRVCARCNRRVQSKGHGHPVERRAGSCAPSRAPSAPPPGCSPSPPCCPGAAASVRGGRSGCVRTAPLCVRSGQLVPLEHAAAPPEAGSRVPGDPGWLKKGRRGLSRGFLLGYFICFHSSHGTAFPRPFSATCAGSVRHRKHLHPYMSPCQALVLRPTPPPLPSHLAEAVGGQAGWVHCTV